MSADSLLKRYKQIHESYMKKILEIIFSSPYKDIIAFKWWTLAYFHYDLPRFSTDIDLDLLDITKEKEVIDYMNQELPLIGEVERPMLGRDLHRWKFHYDQNGRNIKIELNKRQHLQTKYEIIIINDIAIQVQTAKSMVTNKLLALGDRRYNRDLYDIHFFLKQWYIFDENIIQEKKDKSLVDWINMIINEIPNRFQTNAILHQLGEVLDDLQKPRVKNHLANETIELLKFYLDNNSDNESKN